MLKYFTVAREPSQANRTTAVTRWPEANIDPFSIGNVPINVLNMNEGYLSTVKYMMNFIHFTVDRQLSLFTSAQSSISVTRQPGASSPC